MIVAGYVEGRRAREKPPTINELEYNELSIIELNGRPSFRGDSKNIKKNRDANDRKL